MFYIEGAKVYVNRKFQDKLVLQITHGVVSKISSDSGFQINNQNPVLKLESSWSIIPGAIDVHIHGAAGADAMDGDSVAITKIAKILPAEGTTAFLATTMSADSASIEKALIAIGNHIKSAQQNTGAECLGIHLEGPYISKHKKGAQNELNIVKPSVELFKKWELYSQHHIKMVTIAPEEDADFQFIQYLKSQNIIASIGHTNADYEKTKAAINAGCSHATHLFNGMSSIHHREPNAVMALLLDQSVMTELIVDNIYLHPSIVEMTYKLKGKDKIVLITDSMRAKYLGDGTYDLGGQEIIVRNNEARVKQDGALAGSTLKMHQAIRNMMEYSHCTLEEVVQMTSENPALELKIFDRKGEIAENKDADFVVLDDKLEIMLTFCRGEVAYYHPSLKWKLSSLGFSLPVCENLNQSRSEYYSGNVVQRSPMENKIIPRL